MTATFYGYNPPFIGGVQNVLSRQEDIRLIKNDILQLLLTIPGERVMRPDFGVNLRNFVFQPMDFGEYADLESEIRDQVSRQERRVIVDQVVITEDEPNQAIRIDVLTRLRSNPTQEVTVELFLRNDTEIPRGAL